MQVRLADQWMQARRMTAALQGNGTASVGACHWAEVAVPPLLLDIGSGGEGR